MAAGSGRPNPSHLNDGLHAVGSDAVLKLLWRRLITQLYWRARLGEIGPRSVIFKPLMITGCARISVGDGTRIREFARLEVLHRPERGWDANLRIGNRVNIEQGVHIVCQGDLTIEDEVSITPFCAIVDTYHPHDPPDVLPNIGARLPEARTFVTIGRGTFIGTHSVILSNVRIGRGCVIGAGSVVTRDLPDYSVAAGSPARVVSCFNPESRTWVRVDQGQG
jgi:acetyltransferase-like isoleucine patch superfamily enzyme